MSILRVGLAISSLGIALILLFHFATMLAPVILPTVRQLDREETTYLVLRIAGFFAFRLADSGS